MKEQTTETVIIGAGPAGLTVGVCLRKEKRPFILLEKNDKVGAAWHEHYDRLHLHTDKKRSELPYLSYPESYPKYPSRLQVVNYLEQYSGHFDLNPRFNQKVESARFENGSWYTETESDRFISKNLVVATGYNNIPHIPSWPDMNIFEGSILHSSDYNNGEPFQGKSVLVVGFGNSGGEIAIDLHEFGADVSIAVRSPVNIIPRDILGIPILAIAIPLSKLPPRLADYLTAPILYFIFGNLQKLGLSNMKLGPFEQIEKRDRIPLIDVGTVQLIREEELTVYPGVKRFTDREVVFTDGKKRRFDVVVLATGYRPDLESFIDGFTLDDKKHAAQKGLFFCGFEVTATGVLREISLEAQKIVRQIKKRQRELSEANPV